VGSLLAGKNQVLSAQKALSNQTNKDQIVFPTCKGVKQHDFANYKLKTPAT
jgi:hypothetical protein